MYYLTSAESPALWKTSCLGLLFGSSTLLTANPSSLSTVDVVSRFSEDWEPANIAAVLLLQGLSAPARVCDCDVRKGLLCACVCVCPVSFRSEVCFYTSCRMTATAWHIWIRYSWKVCYLGTFQGARVVPCSEVSGHRFLFLRQQKCSSGNLRAYIMAHRTKKSSHMHLGLEGFHLSDQKTLLGPSRVCSYALNAIRR